MGGFQPLKFAVSNLRLITLWDPVPQRVKPGLTKSIVGTS